MEKHVGCYTGIAAHWKVWDALPTQQSSHVIIVIQVVINKLGEMEAGASEGQGRVSI